MLSITRRDFLNGALLGAGAGLLARSPPGLGAGPVYARPGADWYGYGGIGDYAASHGNTPDVVATAHALRDGRLDFTTAVVDTGETFDAIIVGGGLAGLGAAYEFTQQAASGQCLILENHPVFGGEAKRNEFLVDGVRLIAPQGSNGFSVPGVDEGAHASADALYYDALGVPRQFSYQGWQSDRPPLKLAPDHASFLYWLNHRADVGYFFAQGEGVRVARNPWDDALAQTGYPARVREQLLAWRYATGKPGAGADDVRWLDTMSYQTYVEQIMGLDPAVTAFADPILAFAVGLGCDAVSAYAAYAILFPGVINFYRPEVKDFTAFERHSFPGGNDGFARHFLKKIIPAAIAGYHTFAAIMNGAVNFAALDRAGQRVRMRLGATAVRVEHDGEPARSTAVFVIYHRDGKLYRVRARGVVMAAGGWMGKHVVRDLPDSYRQAYASFRHAPFLVANVALTNWRFLYDAGITACRYDDGVFGHACNLRQPMIVGDYRPPNDPQRPAVLTFYVPFFYPGAATAEQCSRGRTELFTTAYAGYEQRIVEQLRRLFGTGFVAERDLAGIILNRWGHAYVVPEPGFYFGRDGRPAARDIIREPCGRIAFGHSELQGNQHWGPAAAEGARAMRQILERG
ncbi:MAG: FAD-binding protein [Gammaproteobacteria bacterium]|nr:FAD-binding protein [Gammaproteobacteria bacterium]